MTSMSRVRYCPCLLPAPLGAWPRNRQVPVPNTSSGSLPSPQRRSGVIAGCLYFKYPFMHHLSSRQYGKVKNRDQTFDSEEGMFEACLKRTLREPLIEHVKTVLFKAIRTSRNPMRSSPALPACLLDALCELRQAPWLGL